MDNVTFDAEADIKQAHPVQKSSAGMTAWMVSKKFAKDETQANYILLGILGVCVVITGFSLMNLFGGGSTVDPEERMRLEQSTPLPQ